MNHRIIFMGTPDFAVASLDALIQAKLDVVAVVTAPDRPAGRGQQLRMSAVKLRAIDLGLPVLQPEKLRNPDFLADLDRLNASLYVVVAFRMLPDAVWDRPEHGTINLHASLLPDYRGAAPINWAIINGEKQTGVTTFRLAAEIDTGDILLRKPIDIGAEEDAGSLHDRMMRIGAELLTLTVKDVLDGTSTSIPQEQFEGVPKHQAPKLTSANCRIDWKLPAANVHDLVRGLSPVPGAWTHLKVNGGPEQHLKIWRTRIDLTLKKRGSPGPIEYSNGKVMIACGSGWIEVLELQPPGKRNMDASSFLNGLRKQATLEVS